MSEFNIEITGSCNDLMRNGFEFLEAAKRCAGTDENGTMHILGGDKPTMLPAATVVNAAFACEMFLKALIIHDGKQYPTGKNGHNLAKLFDHLSPDTKQKINDIIGYSKTTGQPSFEIFVKLHSQDFVSKRYYVATPGWQGLSPVIVYSYAFNLGQVTKYLIE